MIREATLTDGPRLLEMSQRFLTETIYAQLAPADPIAVVNLICVVLEKGVVFVEELPDGTLIGMIAIVPLPHLLTGKQYGDEIVWWVEPEHRKSRAAYRLLCAAEVWARQKGLSVLKLVAPAGSDIGRFYEHRGYVLVESAYQKVLN